MGMFVWTYANGARELLKRTLPLFILSRLLFRIAPVLLASALLQGCSVGGFLSAYFNTYYNADRLFSEAEGEVFTQQKARKGRQEFLAPFAIPQTTRAKLTSVIEKCSKILQNHAESNLVDDALLMVGKAYYYQDENEKAERKFKELIEGYPTSDLVFQSKLYLAYVYYRLNQKPESMTVARELLDDAQKEGANDIVAHASLLLAHIELENKNTADAIVHFQTAADNAETAEDRVAAYTKVAEVYESQEQYQKAADAYLRAEAMSTDYVSDYRSRYGVARMLSKLGKHEEALDMLDALRSNSNNRDFYGEIDLETGNVYNRMNDLRAAIAQYQYVDTAYAKSDVSARSYYEQGRLYETKLMRYDSAGEAYSRGRAQFPSADVQPLLVRRAEIMTRYRSLWAQLGRFDSLRAELLKPRDTLAVAPDTVRHDLSMTPDTTRDDSSMAPDTTRHDSSMAQVQPADSGQVRAPIIPLDSVNAVRARTIIELASFLYSDLGGLDSARYWFKLFLDEFPGNAAAPRALFMMAQIASQDTLQGTTVADSLYRELISRYPSSEFAVEAARLQNIPLGQRRGDAANQTYGRGEDLLEAGDRFAAIDTFKEVERRYPESPLASKAEYAVGWIYEEMLSNQDSAIAHYQQLVAQYPTSEYAMRVRPKLAAVELKLNQEREAARQDSIKKATPPVEQKKMPALPAPADTTNVKQEVPGKTPPPATPASEDTTDRAKRPGRIAQ
jgi:tetratricopeptide (TPR) repeat protein